MTALSKQILLSQASQGMVLSDALIDGHGNVLLAAGATLTEAMLKTLQRHQIESISIVAGELTEKELSAERERHEKRLAKLFRKPANDAVDVTSILMQYVRHYRLREEE